MSNCTLVYSALGLCMYSLIYFGQVRVNRHREASKSDICVWDFMLVSGELAAPNNADFTGATSSR